MTVATFVWRRASRAPRAPVEPVADRSDVELTR
jgi:hypothetical protein